MGECSIGTFLSKPRLINLIDRKVTIMPSQNERNFAEAYSVVLKTV